MLRLVIWIYAHVCLWEGWHKRFIFWEQHSRSSHCERSSTRKENLLHERLRLFLNYKAFMLKPITSICTNVFLWEYDALIVDDRHRTGRFFHFKAGPSVFLMSSDAAGGSLASAHWPKGPKNSYNIHSSGQKKAITPRARLWSWKTRLIRCQLLTMRHHVLSDTYSNIKNTDFWSKSTYFGPNTLTFISNTLTSNQKK
jgi:hypothetical protein